MISSFDGKIIALCGGVGGAKLAWGLAQILPPEQLDIIVNTGDDFEHLGLHISPDLDTVMYTLGNINNRELGWGLAGETWQCMESLAALGGETWFRLGDRDLATHFFRSNALKQGLSLTETTRQLTTSLGIKHRLLPMCNQPLRTLVDTNEGELAFQDYFVRHQCTPAVLRVCFSGSESATLSPEVCAALNDPDLRAVIICPSNPLLSIAPILAVPGMTEALQRTAAKTIVVSPLIGGQAVKGPTAKMMQEMSIPTDSNSIANFYAVLLDVLVVDECDKKDVEDFLTADFTLHACKTLMKTDADKLALAASLLQLV